MKKILVVVDMQNDFIDGTLGSEAAVGILDNVVQKIEEFDGEIAVTYDTHFDNYLNSAESKKLPVVHCVLDSYGWQLNQKIQAALEKKRCRKLYKLSFGSIKLGDFWKGVSQEDMEITLIGLCTDICVISNALILKAAYPEVKIIVDASCCAGTTKENHDAALAVMKSCHIEVIGN